MNGLNIKSLQFKNFMSVGNVLQTVQFENGVMRIVTGEDLDAGKLKRSGIGKAQPLYSKVKTPDGWAKIGYLKTGDFVCTPNGTTTIVSGVYPQGKKDVYRVKFEDGRVVECCYEHLWKVYCGSNGWHIANTKQISKYIENNNVYIPLIDETSDSSNTCFNQLDPYIYGLFLACGSLNDSYDYIKFSTLDENIIDHIDNLYNSKHLIQGKTGILLDDPDKFIMNQLINITEDGMFITDDIIYHSSFEQRKKILTAFMDVYGYDDNNTVKMNLGQNGKEISHCLQKLIFSLGGKARIVKNLVSDTLMNAGFEYTIVCKFKNANIFFTNMEKKTFGFNKFLSLKISSIEKKGIEECVCISIISPEKLYITDNYIVTHNTTMVNALSYCLYNKSVSDIKNNLLPNKTNKKGMYTRVDFEKDGVAYFIERGAKPDVFKFAKIEDDKKETNIETQGTKSDTQIEIEKVLGLSYDLFIMIVTINTIKASFMKSPLSKQRDIIEEILNISELTRKAKVLSEYRIKNTKLEMEKESARIETMVSVNKRAKESLEYAQKQYNMWEEDKKDKLENLNNKLDRLLSIDIEQEIKNHEHNQELKESENHRKQIISERSNTQSLTNQGKKRLHEIEKMLGSFSKNICPTCNQTVSDNSHETKKKELESEAIEYFTILDEADKSINELNKKLQEIDKIEYKKTYYNNITEAHNHQFLISSTKEKINDAESQENPHFGSVENAKNNMDESEINYEHLEHLDKVYKHQCFLQKILTGRDSFVRKRIIDVSIPLLNQQISSYLKQTELTQEIKFNSDLTLEISNRGEEYSFDSLSRGEQNWAIIALNLAMRDLFEQLTGNINVLFVDELIDFGIDGSSAVDAFNIIKNIARDREKSVSLITHREELFENADEILYTIMENGFTSYETRRN